MIAVQHDNKNDVYSGLPTMWRDLLEMPMQKSKNEVDTSRFDSSVAPVAPSKKQLYIIKEKNADGALLISAPQSVEKTFQIKYDNKLGRLVGAPENLQQYLEGFKKEDIEANPEAVLMAADRARQMAEDQDNNVVELPSEEQFSSELKSAAHFSQEDPSKYYEIVKKIGYGGFARVFLVKRKDDGKQYALKFIEPKNAKER